MSQQGMENFLEAAQEDEELQELLLNAEGAEELASTVQKRDFNVTPEEFEELGELLGQFATEMEEELDEQQLEQVAGGVNQSTDGQTMADLMTQLKDITLKIGVARRETHREHAEALFKIGMERKKQAIQQMKQAAQQEMTSAQARAMSQIISGGLQ